jgi:rRNA N6-adenosine-methyltransferase METTL5
MRLRDLRMGLSEVKGFVQTSVRLEQYLTPHDIAASMVYTAHTVYNDIEDKAVLDLCCGTGMLSIACSYFSPACILGMDICREALGVFRENLGNFGTEAELVVGSIDDRALLCRSFDTAVMNPPFGTKARHADIKALDLALEVCSIVYSLHKSSTRAYLLGKYSGAEVLAEIKYELPRTHSFHRKEKKVVEVDFIRFTQRPCS